ncbi:trypsin-like peptidase domain-containing protein [Actinoplanes sp. NPDC020271]|uniref:S1C family serine protease n=1 Tax=Actinoplanes sp. NPDC020271 TaxID=3363896 RepID=UPI0037B5CA7C
MTATYEPFVPAGSSEPGRDRYAARREEHYDDRYQDRYGDQRPDRYGDQGPDRYGDQRQDDGYRQAEDPWAAPQQPAWAQPQPAWQEPEPAPSWAEQPQATWSAPAYVPPAYEAPAPQPASRAAGLSGRTKPIVFGLVAVLLAVVGWQAYRIESVISANDALTSAEKDRNAELEKALTNVFDPEAISTASLPSVFRVRAGDFTGTAFSVGTKAANGTANLFTNFHVVESIFKAGNKSVTLERGNTKINATIVKVDEDKDLALLVAKKTIKPLAVFTGTVKPGQPVVVVGAPLGLDDTVTQGVISAYRQDDDGPTIQFDAPINPGNSGGPVVNAGKQVVALATAKARDAEGIGLGIDIKTACDTFKVC